MTTDNKQRYFGPYLLCGWKVSSELELPELALWTSTFLGADSLTIRTGSLPPTDAAEGVATTADHETILRFPGVCGFCISATGDRVIVDAEEGADPLVIRNYLYGSVLAILCYLHGLFPLHGSSILMDNSAIAFTGCSGAGKSTLATALALRGHSVLSDDVCALEPRLDAPPLLYPSILRVKLLHDAIQNFGLGQTTLYTRAAHGDKGHFGISSFPGTGNVGKSVPLAAVYLLEANDEPCEDIEPLQGAQSFAYWAQQAHRAWIGRRLGLQRRLFEQCSLLAQTVPLCRLKRPRALNRLEETICTIEARHGANAPACPAA